ncbi:transporter substrate-binding domain-containing protein [Volucribacter amazonae]|uniref:transporter substrate-binding domain-containing protein n=1 Tax=Volucribacter amazonae TaxID=256731 RepID=UPI0024417B41|nr:transporter substrate-binding domain-containing protein [Volucribacter amazonae]
MKEIKSKISSKKTVSGLASISASCRKGLVLVLSALWLGQAAAVSLDEVKQRGYLSVATEDDYAPFEMIKDGKPAGFTEDLMVELKAYAPFAIKQEIMPWTGLLPAVLAGKYDAAITGAVVSPERLQRFNFAPPVMTATHYVVLRTKDDSVQSAADLAGKTLGVQAGSVALARLPELEVMLAESGGKLGKVVEYTSYPEAYADLANGRLDYVVSAYAGAKTLTTQRPKVFKMGMAVSGAGYHAWPVPKDSPEVLAFLTAFIEHIRANGKLAEIQQKWFGESLPDLPTTPITSEQQYLEMISQ